jgi:hypothetical protein
MDELYRSRRIHTAVHLNLDADCWIPEARVSWDEREIHLHQILNGPGDRFKIIDQADTYALEMAKEWIDANF